MMQSEEVEVFYILPAIRNGMARALKKLGRKQSEIARILCVQESTVSQYISSKRASGIRLPKRMISFIESAIKKIKNKEDLLNETRKLLDMARQEKLTCSVHKKVADMPEGCRVCFFRK
jgi:uncharacterized protein